MTHCAEAQNNLSLRGKAAEKTLWYHEDIANLHFPRLTDDAMH